MVPARGLNRAKRPLIDKELTMRIGKFFTFITALFAAGVVQAQDNLQGLETVGKPVEGLMGFQPAVTPSMHDIIWLDNMLLVIITAISLFVLALMLWVFVRYNKRANPEPARFTHNSVIEVAWTIIPIIILIVIGSFSLPTLFKQLEVPESDLTIKVTGNQWYWTYEYVEEEFAFDSYMIGQPATLGNDDQAYVLNDAVKAKLAEYGYEESDWLLATDTAVVVPVNAVVRLQITGSDVIHSWTIPAFGVKMDAVPNRLAETWFKAEREGVYFGQCSELCGKDHTYMPITVKVVSQDAYDAWLTGAVAEYASLETMVASAD